MAAVRPIRPETPEPVSLHVQAMDNLRFIRNTMENAGSFTAVPGQGGMLMGATALFAAFAAHLSASPRAWLGVWMGEAALALGIGLVFSYRKATRSCTPLLSKPFRRFRAGGCSLGIRGCDLNLCAPDPRHAATDSSHVAAALWRGNYVGRRVCGARGSSHGNIVSRAGLDSHSSTTPVCRCGAGFGIRRISSCFRVGNCEAVRWLNQAQQKRRIPDPRLLRALVPCTGPYDSRAAAAGNRECAVGERKPDVPRALRRFSIPPTAT